MCDDPLIEVLRSKLLDTVKECIKTNDDLRAERILEQLNEEENSVRYDYETETANFDIGKNGCGDKTRSNKGDRRRDTNKIDIPPE